MRHREFGMAALKLAIARQRRGPIAIPIQSIRVGDQRFGGAPVSELMYHDIPYHNGGRDAAEAALAILIFGRPATAVPSRAARHTRRAEP